ncbi:HAD family hydrolase [Desulfovibrio sp. OttesenSCG-928-G15]|nr:HAD family hydrolase [Desulfovibrio sp. OttesenSCG-928-G15]
MEEQKKGIIFDLDGTLLDTLRDLAEAVNSALVSAGFPPHAVDAYRAFVGDGVYTLIQRAVPAGTGEESCRKVLLAMRDAYLAGWANHTRPYPGIENMLSGLIGRGVPVAVLSNKPHEYTEIMVRHFFPDISFFRVQGSPPGEKAKPEPKLALAIAAHMGLAPAHIFFVGDSNVDMLTAKAANMPAVGVSWGFRSIDELKSHGASGILSAPDDIFALL